MYVCYIGKCNASFSWCPHFIINVTGMLLIAKGVGPKWKYLAGPKLAQTKSVISKWSIKNRVQSAEYVALESHAIPLK